jgi:hypothetical protein
MTRPALSTVQAAHSEHAVVRAVAVLGLVAAAILLVALARTAPSPERGVVTPDSISSIQRALDNGQGEPIAPAAGSRKKRATGRPSRTPTLEDIAWDQTFRSSRYGYTLHYPDGWTAIGAKDPAVSDWIKAPLPSMTTLAIRRYDLPESQNFLAFADKHLRHRAEPDGCHWNSAGIIYMAATWDTLHEITVDGHAGAYRSECGYVDAVIEDGEEFLGMTLKSGKRQAAGQTWWFERFAERLAFRDEPGSAASPGEFTQLRSGVHGYRISYPSDWHVKRATENAESDVIYQGLLTRSGFKSKLAISRRELPAGMTIADVATPWFPLATLRRGECGTRQPFYGKMLRAATFEEATIAGRSALIRSECSVVDAIVDLDGEALLLRLESRRSMTTGDDRLFALLTERLQVDPGESGIPEPR